MSFFSAWIETTAGLGLLGGGAALFLLALLATTGGRARLRASYRDGGLGAVLGAWIVALAATLGSLYLSEGVGFKPCILCWYQRFAMYPLVLLLGAALLMRRPGVWRFALPLPAVGILISAYHAALQLQPSLDIVSCSADAPCTARYVAAFGFVSIPVLAGLAFLMIGALLGMAAVLERREAVLDGSGSPQ